MSRVSFGDFVLDLDSRELLRGRHAVPLAPKAYQLLEILVTNRPKALSKIALQERLWPDTFVVEKNLVNLIAEIRQSLGDDPAHPRFVRTVHRFGYAFQVPPPKPRRTTQPASRPPSDSASYGRTAAQGSAKANTCWDAIPISSSSSIPLAFPGATRSSGSPEMKRRSKISAARTERSLPISVSTLRCGSLTATVIRIGSVQLTFNAVRTSASTRTEPHLQR